MKWKAVQPYFKIVREVTGLEQKTRKSYREMYLDDQKLVTKYREFPREKVLDMSFKRMGDSGGILYLHTDHGVYSYNVEEDPEEFMKAFKQSRN
ncbi:hypothetical protein [Bacillus massiliglaciei]|uniref:hypothetical protein n=1 Tax=Bacillus massiliglaciei TaxID=1816693 RepID=UPI000DA5EFE3|nr:hypothetical protein [Bacillus massiliglaciei]